MEVKLVMKTSLSLLLLTHNESENVIKNLDWLGECPNINEIVIVDDDSTDDTIKNLKTLKLPKNTKLLVLSRKLEGDFSQQRQYGVGKASNDWILWLDADEKPSPELVSFLKSFDPDRETSFLLRRQDYFEGRLLKHGETASQSFLRLFDRRQGHFIGKVHETWYPDSPATSTELTIIHHSHPDLYSFLHKINFYSSLRAQELYDQKVSTNLFQIIFYPTGKFIKNYFFKLGFLDSTPGIIMALTMSFHSFLVRSKLWHLSQK